MCEEDNGVRVKIGWMNNHWPYEAKGAVGGNPFAFKVNVDTWSLSILKSQRRPNPDYAENIGWHYWGDTSVCFPESSFITKSNIRSFIKEAVGIWHSEDRHSYFRCKYIG